MKILYLLPSLQFNGAAKQALDSLHRELSDHEQDGQQGFASGHPHVVAFAAANEAKTVVLNLVRPLRSGRHRLAEGRQARCDESGRQ